MSKSSLFLKALACQNDQRPPVWIMRQAGRYMSSYKKLREKHSLATMFHDPELIYNVTMLPIDELHVDAAIVFSDILLPFEAFGGKVIYENDKPPHVVLHHPLHALKLPSQEELKEIFAYLLSAMKALKKTLNVPLIGFCGAPFTLVSYLLETSSHHLMRKTKTLMYQDPHMLHQWLSLLTDLIIDYAIIQIQAGADVIQLFDSWAGVLDQQHFETCCALYLKKILQALKPYQVPVIIYCRGSCLFAKELAALYPDCISFDWHRPLPEIASKIPSTIALQGNIDPDFLRAPLSQIRSQTQAFLTSMRHEKRFIANLGHGVLPDLPYDGVKCFVDTVLES